MGAAKFIRFKFDGWSTVRSESVYGFELSFVDGPLEYKTKCMGNFRMGVSHAADDVCLLISRVVHGRLGAKTLNCFVSDSAPVNKAAVRIFIENAGGDDY